MGRVVGDRRSAGTAFGSAPSISRLEVTSKISPASRAKRRSSRGRCSGGTRPVPEPAAIASNKSSLRQIGAAISAHRARFDQLWRVWPKVQGKSRTCSGRAAAFRDFSRENREGQWMASRRSSHLGRPNPKTPGRAPPHGHVEQKVPRTG